MLQITNHWNENAPPFNILTDSEEGVALSISNLDGLKSLSHLFNFIFHFIDIHLRPFEFKIIIESVLAFLNMMPQLLHPSNLNLNCFNDFLTSVCFTLGEFEHLFIVNELI